MQPSALSPLNPRMGRDRVTIYDSTLRDGEQMPNLAFTLDQKVTIARMLDEVGLPQIEVGFPAVSEGEFRSIREIASLGLDADTLALTRLLRKDIDITVESGVDMALLFIATSDLHMRYKLRKGEGEIIDQAVDAVEYCRERGIEVSFSAEDSTRTDLDFLLRLFKAVEEAGVDRLGLTDTVGCACPEAIQTLVSTVKSEVSSPLSLHLHNDYGLALPNAIAGIKSGADAITTTVNGIGERSGNVALEQLVSCLEFIYHVDTGIDTTRLYELCEMVAAYGNHHLPKNHPLVGENAFAHESGIHVAAVLNCPLTYESIPPEWVGNRRRLHMGKHSGITYIRRRMEELGFAPEEEHVCEVLLRVKRRAEEGGQVTDEDFRSIVVDVLER